MSDQKPKPMEITLYGIKLTNKDLLQEESLQLQLTMLLEIIADYNGRFELINRAIVENKDEHNRRIAETNEQVHKLGTKVKSMSENLVQVRKDLETLDQSQRRLDNKVTQSINETAGKIKELNEGLLEVRLAVDDHAPRLERVEKQAAKNAEDMKEGFRLQNQKVAELDRKTSERMDIIQEASAVVEGRVGTLERKLEEADIEGLTRKVTEVQRGMEEQKEKQAALEKATESLKDACGVLRRDIDEHIAFIKPYVDDTFATKPALGAVQLELRESVSAVQTELRVFSNTVIRSYLSKEEYASLQDDFHRNMTNHVADELQQQREELFEKISAVQERFAAEIEEVSKSDDWQVCVVGLQKLVQDVENIGVSVSDHTDAIERTAQRFGTVGKDLDVLRSGIADVSVRVEGVYDGLQDKVRSAVKELGLDKKLHRGSSMLQREPSAEQLRIADGPLSHGPDGSASAGTVHNIFSPEDARQWVQERQAARAEGQLSSNASVQSGTSRRPGTAGSGGGGADGSGRPGSGQASGRPWSGQAGSGPHSSGGASGGGRGTGCRTLCLSSIRRRLLWRCLGSSTTRFRTRSGG